MTQSEIIKIAGIGEPRGAGRDGYCDKYGDEILSEWGFWRVEA